MSKMNDIDLNSIYSLSLKIFTIIKKEYELYLTKEKKDFIDNLDVFKFYKVINDKSLPNIYYMGDVYYLNTFYDLSNIEKIIPFLCFSSISGNINPLKIGLIENEIKNIKEKYEINIVQNFEKEMDVAEILLQGLFNDLPDKIVFKDSDLQIINYLNNEMGVKIGSLYYEISKKMKDRRPENKYYDSNYVVNYDDIIDTLYSYISHKVR